MVNRPMDRRERGSDARRNRPGNKYVKPPFLVVKLPCSSVILWSHQLVDDHLMLALPAPVTVLRHSSGLRSLSTWSAVIRRLGVCLAGIGLVSACAAIRPVDAAPADRGGYPALDLSTSRVATQSDPLRLLNRITWGSTASDMEHLQAVGAARYLEEQLRPNPAAKLPPEIENTIAQLSVSQMQLADVAGQLREQQRALKNITDDEQRAQAKQAEQKTLNLYARDAASRSLLRAVYSPQQLQEQLVWFWSNHFSVFQGKHQLRVAVGDFEEQAIRPHVLGKFRDLLAATAHHPAMLMYLDNQQNAAGHINENYARELMELHTLGVNGGYSQQDVQELARILTGVGVNLEGRTPNIRRDLQGQYVQNGLFEFNPNRHDYGSKVLLGQAIRSQGLAELDEALDRLARHPATARFISRKLAQYFVSDTPSEALVNRMAKTFLARDGDISETLRTLFASDEFAESLGKKFKDPVHYVVSAVRLAYDKKPILNPNPMLGWLNRMGQPLFGRQTPDGYPMTEAAWSGSGQMTNRFEVAKALGSGHAGLFRTEAPNPVERPAFPQLANPLYYSHLQKQLSPSTQRALDQASSPQEWNSLLLASPEFMYR